MTFDLDLWPIDLNINRDHLLTKDYLPTKFEASGAKRYWVISCTRLRDTDIPTYRPTDRQVQSNMPSFFKGGHKYIAFKKKGDFFSFIHLLYFGAYSAYKLTHKYATMIITNTYEWYFSIESAREKEKERMLIWRRVGWWGLKGFYTYWNKKV